MYLELSFCIMQAAAFIENILLSAKVKRFKRMDNPPNVHFTEFDSCLIRYHLSGNGSQTIVFIPNAPNMIEHYSHLIQLLEKDFKVLIFELPGLGFSLPKKWRYGYSLKECAQIAIDLLDRLHIKDATLAFSCLSGYIALKIAELRPDLVRQNVCIQTLCWEDQAKWGANINQRLPIGVPFWGQILMRMKKKAVASNWYKHVVPDAEVSESFTQIACENFDKGAQYALASAYQGLFGRSRPRLIATSKPAVILWGSSDKSHRKSNPWSILQYFTNYDPHEFSGAGHFPELEQPERFVRLLQEERLFMQIA